MDHDRENPNHPEDTSPKTLVYLIAIAAFWAGCVALGLYAMLRLFFGG